MDRLEEWRIFTAVATQRSFSAAARSLGRSPQAVTRAVAAVEARLGARLLHRTTRSVSLTDLGERILERARHAVAELDRLELREDADAPLAGRLSITAPVLFGQLHVMPLVATFLEAHPGLDVRVLLLDRVVSLADEGIDLGVRIGALADSGLRARPLGHVRSLVVASPAYLRRAGVPRSPEQVRGHACVTFTGTTPALDRWSFPVPGARSRTVAIRPRLVVNTGQAAIDAALAGVGLVRILSYQVGHLVAAGRLRVVLARFEAPPVPVHLVRLPGLQSHASSAFAEHVATPLRRRLAT